MDRVLLFDVATKCYIATDTETIPTIVSENETQYQSFVNVGSYLIDYLYFTATHTLANL